MEWTTIPEGGRGKKGRKTSYTYDNEGGQRWGSQQSAPEW